MQRGLERPWGCQEASVSWPLPWGGGACCSLALVCPQRPSSPTCMSAPECFCLCSDLKLRVRILIDGTLIIFRVKPEDAGKYTCVPSNSLGRSPSASAYLTVQCESGREIPGGWCIQKLQALDPDWRLEGSRDRVWAQGVWAEWLEGRRNIPRGGGPSWPIR